MKKLNITQGSRTPFWMRDLEYITAASSEVFAAMLKGLSLEARDFVISGCRITETGSKVSMTGGWCYYGGEVLPVLPLPPTTYSGTDPRIKFTKVTRYDHEGDRVIELEGVSGMSQIYSDDCLQPSLVSSGDSYRLAIGRGAWNLGERIANAARHVDSGVVEAELAFGGTGLVRYRQAGGIVQLYGSLFNDSLTGFSGVVARGLPQPAVGIMFPLGAGGGSGSIQIGIDGTLSISTQSNRVYLDHVVYVATPVTLSDDRHYLTLQPDQQQGGELYS